MRLLINNLEVVIIVPTDKLSLALGWLESKGISNPFTCSMDGAQTEAGICVPLSTIPTQVLAALLKRVTGMAFKVSEVGGDDPQKEDVQDSPQAVSAPVAPPAPVAPQPPAPAAELEPVAAPVANKTMPTLSSTHIMSESLLIDNGYISLLPGVEYNPIELAEKLSALTGYKIEHIAAPQLSVVPDSTPVAETTQPETKVSIPKKGRTSKASIIKLLNSKDAETIEKLRTEYGVPNTASKRSAIATIAECLISLDNSERDAALAG